MRNLRRPSHGFTLIEMVVVVAIVGILVTAAQPLVELTLRRAQEHALREGLRQLRTAIDEYKAAVETKKIARASSGSPYPPSLAVLVQGAPLVDEQGKPREDKRLYLLRRLPRDPFAPAGQPPEQSWGLRASDSPPEAPRAGEDVFDVFSRAPGTAIDGSKYRDW